MNKNRKKNENKDFQNTKHKLYKYKDMIFTRYVLIYKKEYLKLPNT